MRLAGRESGFTLVELIVATTLTVLVAASTVGIVRSVTATRQRVDRQAILQQEARAGLSAMAAALRNAHRAAQSDWMLEGVDEWWGDVPADRLRLFTVSRRTIRPDQPQSDVHECEFFLLAPDERPASALMRRTDPTLNEQPDGGGVLECLARHVVGMDISYHDGLDWREDWPATLRDWPAAIRLQLIVMTETTPPVLRSFSRIINFPYLPAPEAPKKAEEGKEGEEGAEAEKPGQPEQP